MKRALIIGAGPGGLASAMLLARAGVQVDVFERNAQVGGRTRTFDQDGFRFDLGPTFFMYPRVLDEIFRQCGYDLRSELDLIRLDPQYRLVFEGGGRLDATPDPLEMERQITALSPRDSGGFRRLMEDNRGKLERFRPILESSFSGWRDLLRTDVLRLAQDLKPWRSIHSELGQYFSDERLKLAFTFQSKYLGMSPFRCPSIFTILSFLEYEHGVFHVRGGLGAVSEKMGQIARELGVRIHLDEPVDSLIFRGKRITGVRTRTGAHHADAVVINADFARAMKQLVPNRLRKRWSNRKLEKASYSCSTYMMYLGVKGEYPELSHHNILIPTNYREHLDDIELRQTLSDEPSVYVQNACVSDPDLAPAGHSALYVLVPVPHRSPHVDWSREKWRFRGKVLKQLEKLGLRGLSDRIVSERIITPDDWEGAHAIHKGAVFNLAHGWDQMLHLRPNNRFRDLDGMYLVGGGTHPGSGLPVIYEGARITSKLLTKDLGLRVDWTVPERSSTPNRKKEVA